MSDIIKMHIGDEIAGTSEDVFTFIIRGKKNPETLMKEVVREIKVKAGHLLRFSYVLYPLEGKNADELMCNLDLKTQKSRLRKIVEIFFCG